MSLELTRVAHWYRPGQELLRNISIVFRAGTTTAISGPSGSGKTTLLSIAGLLQVAREGLVSLDGQAITGRRQAELARAKISWIFQSANVLGRRSVFDNVALGGFARGADRRMLRNDIGASLERVGLSEFGERRAATLSGGELQRLSIARALVGRPLVVLADEPTGQLDRANTELVASLLIGSFGNEAAVIVATHDERVAAACTHHFRLIDGALHSA